MKTWLFNPFTYVAGSLALAIGMAAMLGTMLVAFYSNTHFDGAIDAHIGAEAPLLWYAIEQLLAWGSLVLAFLLIALVLSKSNFRLIDIAGTVALARAPMLLVAIAGFLPSFQNAKTGPPDAMLLISGLVILFPVGWMIALMYNAFTTSANIKGTKGIIGFLSALTLAEILAITLHRLLQPIILNQHI